MGRPPKTIELKLLTGNPGKRKLPPRMEVSENERATPQPPPHLSEEALAEWNRRAPDLVRKGYLDEHDVAIFALYCTAWSDWVDANADVTKFGKYAKGKNGIGPSASWNMRAQAKNDLLRLAIELGLSAITRTRLSSVTVNQNKPRIASRPIDKPRSAQA